MVCLLVNILEIALFPLLTCLASFTQHHAASGARPWCHVYWCVPACTDVYLHLPACIRVYPRVSACIHVYVGAVSIACTCRGGFAQASRDGCVGYFLLGALPRQVAVATLPQVFRGHLHVFFLVSGGVELLSQGVGVDLKLFTRNC